MTKRSHASTTVLMDDQFRACLAHVMKFLSHHESINNSGLRALCSISYDQAIYFFNEAIARGLLERQGRGGATRYVRPK
jgi:hypothetical protein